MVGGEETSGRRRMQQESDAPAPGGERATDSPAILPLAAGEGSMPRWKRASAWVSSTYFAEGFPYGVVNNLIEILFKELGATLQVIGLTSLFHLPWNLKFLWGPLVDEYETKRSWIVATEVVLSLGLAVLALVVGASPLLAVISVCVAVLAVLSATHDIAIDGYYLEGLDERAQSEYVGFRATAYKIASLVVGGPLLILIGWLGWQSGLALAAGVMVLLTAFHAIALPRVERRRRPGSLMLRALLAPRVLGVIVVLALLLVAAALLEPLRRAAVGALEGVGRFSDALGVSLAGWIVLVLLGVLVVGLASLERIRRSLAGRDSSYAAAFVDFLAQPRIGVALAFIVVFRAGESFLVKMRWPFLRDELGMTLDEYGFANGTLGAVASFSATFFGGHLIARDGLRRWIWPFVLAQNVLNLLYVWLAWLGPERAGLATMTAVIALEQLGAGFGTAVFMVYLMRCCDPAHRASHMAIVTALMSVSFTLAGVASGFLAASLGFGPYFALTFVATVPGMLLVFFLPYLDGRQAVAARG